MASFFSRVLGALGARRAASRYGDPAEVRAAQSIDRKLERGEGARPTAALAAVLRAAAESATAGSRRITAEHLLLALVRDAEVAALLGRLGADVAHLEAELVEYIELLDEAPVRRVGRYAPAAERALGRAVVQMTGGGRSEIAPRDLLPALFAEEDEYAASLLYAEGITRLALLRHLSHSDAPAAPTPSAPRLRVVLHNDDFTTMEFVVDVLRDVFHRPEKESLALMLEVHRGGRAVVGEYARAEALGLVEEVTERAERAEFPLRCSVEAAEGGTKRD